jgi:periplasmic protein TonB
LAFFGFASLLHYHLLHFLFVASPALKNAALGMGASFEEGSQAMKHQFEKRDFFTNLRLALGLPVAAMVTAGLFLVMAGLIEGPDTVPTAKAPDAPDFTIFRDKDGPEPIKEVPQRPERIPPPPEPSTTTDYASKRPDGGHAIGKGPVDVTPGKTTITTTVLLPTIRFPFAYPARCAQKGAEGTVVVEFDLAPDGSVINPRIISTPDQCFSRDTLRGIKNWKYPPSAEGKVRRNIRERIDFRLTE